MEEEVKKPAAEAAEQLQTEPQPEAQPAPGQSAAQPPETEEKESRFDARKKEKSALKAAAKLEKELDDAKKKFAAAEKDLHGAKETLVRTAAEYENYRKRTAKEKEASFGNGVTSAVTELLPVVDTLEMAVSVPTADEAYKKGVELTLQKCKTAFEKLGIEEIDAAGKPFDPELHNAVMQESPEGVESGTVTKVLQKGYTLSGKVVRHAAVAVAQ